MLACVSDLELVQTAEGRSVSTCLRARFCPRCRSENRTARDGRLENRVALCSCARRLQYARRLRRSRWHTPRLQASRRRFTARGPSGARDCGGLAARLARNVQPTMSSMAATPRGQRTVHQQTAQ
eukprot:3558026-Pleurochrysis_carterae.AAC.1